MKKEQVKELLESYESMRDNPVAFTIEALIIKGLSLEHAKIVAKNMHYVNIALMHREDLQLQHVELRGNLKYKTDPFINDL